MVVVAPVMLMAVPLVAADLMVLMSEPPEPQPNSAPCPPELMPVMSMVPVPLSIINKEPLT